MENLRKLDSTSLKLWFIIISKGVESMEKSNVFESIFNPTSFDYELSEKLFLDVWTRWNKPEQISDAGEIVRFLKEIVEESDGLVIVDHFSHSNYDNVHSIQYEEPYTKIVWKDFNYIREKYLAKNMSEDDAMHWDMFGCATYTYTLLHIRKIKFIQVKNHLFVLLLSHLIPYKQVKKFLLKDGNELIGEENNKEDFYREFVFWEGDKENVVKHICTVNNLPYYTCLLQPKEGNLPTSISRKIMLYETLNEVVDRMNKVKDILEDLDEYDYDQLFAQGNSMRRILEYALKFFCLYNEIELKIDVKYGNVMLGDLKKQVNDADLGIEIKQELVTTSNELSHDSGEIFSKDEVIEFWGNVRELLDQVSASILK
ncbi:hypothetical protein PVJ1_00002 [Psychrobacillus phage PVJ1]|nr:hypothetical protein PVJ1_00002 [Psychrobacillus phage PVJ1]